jgi:hypothetical protein
LLRPFQLLTRQLELSLELLALALEPVPLHFQLTRRLPQRIEGVALARDFLRTVGSRSLEPFQLAGGG